MFYSDADFSPDCSIGYLVRRVHQIAGAELEPVFAAEGLNGSQWQALVSIWFGRGQTAAELARDLGHDKGAMTRLVDVLEQRGWVVRQRASDDRRCVHLALTDDGQAVALRCKTHVVARWNDWLAGWSDRDAETLVTLLQKLRATLAPDEGVRA